MQHDETLTTARQQVTNMRAGISWLKEAFPNRKKQAQVLWQIDPFGSSVITPFLFNDQQKEDFLNFSYLVLNRIGDNTKDQMKANKQMDFYSVNSHSPNSGLLTHVLHNHYDTQGLDLMKKIQETENQFRRPGLGSLLK